MQNLQPFSKQYRSFYLLFISLATVAAIWILVTINFDGQTFIGCPSKMLLHIPCPGCGMTRATISFIQGNILQAIRFNPNSIILIPLLMIGIFCLIIDILLKRTYTYKFYHLINKIFEKTFILYPFLFIEFLVWLRNMSIYSSTAWVHKIELWVDMI